MLTRIVDKLKNIKNSETLVGGPILGSLLAGSLTADGGAMQLSAGMTGFGLALALPFTLFALFPSWLKSLPSSGGWLNTTKVILGFLELAFAFKFLSNADLVDHWGFLKRELFIGIWIIIFINIIEQKTSMESAETLFYYN